MVEILVKDNPNLVLSKDKHGMTPLHWSAKCGHKNIAEFLLANNAQVNAKDAFGRTPELVTVQRNKKDLVEFLLAHGTEVNAKDNSGRTPL